MIGAAYELITGGNSASDFDNFFSEKKVLDAYTAQIISSFAIVRVS